MGPGLQPLEFTECLSDSPQFREKLHQHEKELDKTSHQIKRLIKEVKELLTCAKRLSAAQITLAVSLEQFDFECIGSSMTEDEVVISRSLAQFAQLIKTIEDERERMLGRAYDQIIQPLEKFRKEHIGAVKEGKKKFDKKTAKFCQSQERNLNLSTKKQDNVFQEADALMDMAERDFCQASLEYVFLLQEVQERKKFEFVEILLGFIFGWWTFYHQGHEVHQDAKPYMQDLQLRIQKTRSNFEETSKKTESLMKKMMEMRQMNKEESTSGRAGCTRAGYLFLMEKKAFGTTWSKQYCTYRKSTKEFTMTPFNQITVKMSSVPDTMVLSSCVRRMSESIDKRFCFDVTAEGRGGAVYTLQALSEADRKAWLDAMDGKEPTYEHQSKAARPEERPLDETGFAFVQRCIQVLESRGLEEQGLYRVTGVASKVSKLVAMGLDRRKGAPANLEEPCEWESKTITSALKTYLRMLPEPLMTYRYHNGFIAAAKQENRLDRINDVHTLVHRLPKQNFDMLDIVVRHLRNVVCKADKNLMSVSNVAVCFGPTLLRPEEETVASIMDLKFYNVVVEILVENYERIFRTQPPPSPPERDEKVNGTLRLRAPPAGAPAMSQQEPRAAAAAPRPHSALTHNAVQVKTYYDGPLAAAGGGGGGGARKPPLNNVSHLTHINRGYSPPPPLSQQQMSRQQPRYSPHQHQILHQFGGSAHTLGGHTTELHRDTLLNSTSSSNESMSSISSRDLLPPAGHLPAAPAPAEHPPHASPVKTRRSYAPPHHLAAAYYATSYRPQPQHNVRVRTLYACLGESEGELSFEPNQIITNVKSSAEPGWLEGTLNGKTGLVPENYVEALP